MASEFLRRTPRLLSFALGLALSLSAHAASAEPSAADKETARHLMKMGDEKLAAKDFKAALSSFESAHLIMGVPTTGLGVARARAGLGELVEARDMALEIARSQAQAGEPAAFDQARADAGAFAKELEGRIPSLVIEISGAPAGAKIELSIDGHLVPVVGAAATRRVNPGARVVTAVAEGLPAVSAKVTVAEGAAEKIALRVGGEGSGGGAGTGGAVTGDALIDAARLRDGFHVGFGGGPSVLLPLTGGVFLGGGVAPFVNVGLSPRIDARLGAQVSMHASTGGDGYLYVGAPVSLHFHVSSRYSIWGGASMGYGNVFSEYPINGFAGGPEWSLLSLRLGERREIELDFTQGFRFAFADASYYNGFTLSYLLLDD